MTLSFDSSPYYDDYNKHKHFYKILYRPSYALQARELTQMQTMLQAQVSRMGDHLFKNGTLVIPGELSFDNEFHYVKLNAAHGSYIVSSFINNLVGVIVVGATSGVQAQVVAVAASTATEPNTLYVKYNSTGTSSTFVDNETIAPLDAGLSTLSVTSISSLSTGTGSAASIKEGVYYVNGYFVLCEDQTIILDKYTATPTYSIGFNVTETITTPESDETLLDNAQGSYNYSAPGAHRHSIVLELTKKTNMHDIADTTKYIQLVDLVLGKPTSMYNQTQYAELAKVMARRTYDESGDYTVEDFKYTIRDHRNNDRGAWVTSTAYMIGDYATHSGNVYVAETSGTSGSLGIAGTWPVTVLTSFDDGGVIWRLSYEPKWNNGLYSPANGGDETKFALGIERGKAYVRGFEIEKVATSFLVVPKARTYASKVNASVVLDVGNFIEITNVHGLPDLLNMPVATFYNAMTTTGGLAPAGVGAVAVGTGRIRYFELRSGTIGSATAIYRLGLFNVVMSTGYDFARDVKQVYAFLTDTNHTFTADISPILTQQAGTVTCSGANLVGTGTAFTTLKNNDTLVIGGINYRVTQANPISSSSAITIDPTLTQAVGVVFSLGTTKVIEPENSNLIFPVAESIKSMRGPAGAYDLNYSTFYEFTGSTDGAGDIILTIPYGGSTVKFASADAIGNYIGVYGAGVLKDLQGLVTLSVGDQTATVHFGGGVPSQAVSVIAVLNKTGSVGTEKIKTATYINYIPATEAIGTARSITLTKADGIKLVKVMMNSGTWAVPHQVLSVTDYTIDITNRYMFDDGQTDSYYDRSKVVLIDGQQAPIAPIEITWKYFSHTGAGDYFTVNSYTNTVYASLPAYNGYRLGDCFDFRPRISDDGVSFTATGGSAVTLPKRGSNVSVSFDYYLGRSDKLCLEPSGDFHIIPGTPSLQRLAPPTSPSGMLLNILSIDAYTSSRNSVSVETIDNRRYTMRDIGKLETRINNLEYYTTLSLAEQGTSNMSIIDTDGLSRYKNGFIVDSFNGHGIGDATAVDYMCAIDSQSKTLRPFHTMSNVTLYETNTAARNDNNYTMTGDLITLKYTHRTLINQGFASRVENVNPFAVFAFVGSMNINPESDNWFETARLPNIVNNVEGNYNTLLSQHASGGTLGTVWNAWENVWFGAPYTTSATTATTSAAGTVTTKRYQGGRYAGGRWVDVTRADGSTITTKTTTTNRAQTVGQTRVGLNTTVTPRQDVTYVGDSVVSSVVIPYMRSRNVAFVCYGLKSNTQLYSYFDTTAASTYVTPATKIKLTDVINFSNVYDTNSNAGSNSEHAARKIGNKLDLALNKGFIIVGQTSGATAVVMYQEPIVALAGFVNIYVSNIRGTFANGETVIGSLDGGIVGSKGVIAELPTVLTEGSPLTSNYAGVACGIFRIPNTDKLSFVTGDRVLSFKDTVSGAFTTSSSSTYHAVGILNTTQSTFTSTRNASVVATLTSETGVITSTLAPTQSVTTAVTYSDPLAQTFIVDTPDGVFATKVEIFFQTKETVLSTPVRVEIRDVVNGTPATRVLPFSTVVLDPSEVNVSATGTVATTFTFKSPVYLHDRQEYAIVILSDSNNYNVFISQMGESDIATGKMISTQPTLGVLFKSSNGSTWNSNQLQDLKFNLYRASFTMNTGLVEFANAELDAKLLFTDPISITSGSNVVRIWHPNHGMPDGSHVTISGATTVGNITNTVLNVTSVIANVEYDSYTITVTGAAATSTARGGGSVVLATENIQFDIMHADTSELVFQNTSVEYAYKTTTGRSVNGAEVEYIKDTAATPMGSGQNIVFSAPRMVASKINETNHLSSAKSMSISATLKSTRENLSPVIDMQRLSVALVQNKLNNPTLENSNVAALDNVAIIASNKIAFDAAQQSIYIATAGNAAELALLSRLSVGRYLNIAGDVTNVPTAHPAHNGDWLIIGTETIGANFHVKLANNITIVSVASGTNTITLVQHERFIDEICPMYGNVLNKYISREIVLAQPSTYLKVKLDVNIPPLADIQVYYRTNPVASSASIQSVNWVKAVPTTVPSKTSTSVYTEVDFDIPDILAFDALQVKIVLTSSSTSQTPSCKSLRIVACA